MSQETQEVKVSFDEEGTERKEEQNEDSTDGAAVSIPKEVSS